MILAFLQNPEEIEEPFEFYINKGGEVPTAEKHDIIMEDIWNFGKGVLFELDNKTSNYWNT